MRVNGAFQRRYERIALFGKGPDATHAARQLGNGKWSSKLGAGERIEHELELVAGYSLDEYGDIQRFMRRPRPLSRMLLEPIYYFATDKLARR